MPQSRLAETANQEEPCEPVNRLSALSDIKGGLNAYLECQTWCDEICCTGCIIHRAGLRRCELATNGQVSHIRNICIP